MEIEKAAPMEFVLMDGERLDSKLELRDGMAEPDDGSYMMLTDRRLIQLNGDGRRGGVSFVALEDVTAIDVQSEQESNRAGYLWGAVALIVALLLWRTWDQPLWSALAGLAVAAMGVYLIVDRRTSPPGALATFQAGSAVLRFKSRRADAAADMYRFVNRLFQLKGEAGERGRPRKFSPR